MTSSTASFRLYDGVKSGAASRGTWLSLAGRSIAYGELCQAVDRVGGLLAAHGVRLGDRVVMAMADDGDCAILFTALVCHGVTVVQIDPDAKDSRAAALLARAKPALAILDPDLRAAWLGEAETAWPVVDIPAVARQRSRGLNALLGGGKTRSGLETLLEGQPATPPPAQIPPDTLAYILFTSGTTGESKGVSISHEALFSHLASLCRVYGLTPASRILNILMLSHADGMIQGPLLAFAAGASVHRPASFEIGGIERLLDSIFQLRITHMICVPTMLSLMVRFGGERRDAFQGGDFRYLVSCGAALEADLWRRAQDSFGVEIVNGYGLTETVAGGVFAGGVGGAGTPGSIGQPVDCELRIVDDAGAPAAEGELLIRGSLLTSGYFEDPERTRLALVDGWLHTGDIARRDAAGDYWISGRKKSIIIRGGLNIHPEEIGEALNRHPAVREAVAFGEPDPDWGETVTAVVAAGGATTPEDLQAFCRDHLEARKVPGRIVLVAALPKGRSGKVALDEARALAAKATSSRPAGDIEVDRGVLAAAAGIFGVDISHLSLATTPDSVVGWDSLAHLNLVFAVEEAFGIQLSPREIMGLDSLGVLADVVRSR